MGIDWAILAILHSASQGWISILDKYNSSRLVQEVRTYYLLLGALSIPVGVAVLLLAPFPENVPLMAIFKAILGSLALGAALMLMFKVYRTHEVSRVVPITQSYPIFVAIIATLFLGEHIGIASWACILITVVGVILISLQRTPGKSSIALGRPFILMLLASFGIAIFNILSKSALAHISVWNMYAINDLAVGASFIAMSLKKTIMLEASQVMRRPQSMAMVVAVLLVNLIGATLLFASLENGPVSLVSTIAGTRPVFVFVYALLLSYILPRFLQEQLTRRVFALKSVSIAMIVGGGSGLVLV